MIAVQSWGPNFFDGFHIHKQGCADTKRGKYLLSARNGEPGWDIDVASEKELVEEHYGPQAGSFYEEMGLAADDPDAWENYRGEFRIFPCVGDLPTR